MSKHRAERPVRVRARSGRIAAAALSLAVTAVALLGGIGVIPVRTGDDAATDGRQLSQAAAASTESTGAGTPSTQSVTGVGAPQTPAATTTTAAKPTPEADSGRSTKSSRVTQSTALPAGTGSGRRVVFSESAQRVWLVDAADKVVSTYLVSGSLTDNLHPGSYDVYSRSRWAVGVDDSGVMQYFVRFTRGDNAAIGFHSIPTKNGEVLQTLAQLGTPQSHGCIRQKLADAQRMWDFASVGTDVVVI